MPVPGGGIPQPERLVSLKLTFKEGGAFDLSTTYERMKETLTQAVDTARASGRPVNGGGGGLDVDLEQLPAYEELGGWARAPVQIQRPMPVGPNGAHRPAPPANNGVVGLEAAASSAAAPTPDEPPPGYEEVLQNSSVGNDLERRVEKS